jgi:hypothetical protein
MSLRCAMSRMRVSGVDCRNSPGPRWQWGGRTGEAAVSASVSCQRHCQRQGAQPAALLRARVARHSRPGRQPHQTQGRRPQGGRPRRTREGGQAHVHAARGQDGLLSLGVAPARALAGGVADDPLQRAMRGAREVAGLRGGEGCAATTADGCRGLLSSLCCCCCCCCWVSIRELPPRLRLLGDPRGQQLQQREGARSRTGTWPARGWRGGWAGSASRSRRRRWRLRGRSGSHRGTGSRAGGLRHRHAQRPPPALGQAHAQRSAEARRRDTHTHACHTHPPKRTCAIHTPARPAPPVLIHVAYTYVGASSARRGRAEGGPSTSTAFCRPSFLSQLVCCGRRRMGPNRAVSAKTKPGGL